MLHRRTFLTSCLALPALSLPVLADDSVQRAVDVTERLLGEAHEALLHGNGNDALRLAISSAFHFDTWERFLLDKHGSRLDDAQRAQFRAMLPGFMAHLYHQQFDRGLNQAPSVGNVRKVRRDALVESRFKRANGRDLPVEWRIRDFPEGARVIDVMVAGTSFLTLKREEFSALIDQGGAPRLLDYMRQNSL